MNTTQKRQPGCERSSTPTLFQPEMWTSEELKKCDRRNCEDTHNATSLPESAAGHTPCNLPDGLPTGPCGRDHAPASRSASQEKEKELRTNGTSGPCLPNSSEPATLQRCLANRLRQRLAGIGSPEYSLTWKEWTINGQEPICALRASALRTSDSDCSGWPTPNTNNVKGAYLDDAKNLARKQAGRQVNLQDVARLAGWPTPIVNDVTGSTHCYGKMNRDGTREVFLKLPGAVKLFNAETEKPAASRLNPLFSLWLMGYPVEWGYCGAQAMPSSPKSRRSSSPLSSTAEPSPAGPGQASAG